MYACDYFNIVKMIVWWCFFLSVVVQLTSAQATNYGVPNRFGNNARMIPKGMAIGRGMQNGLASNNIARNTPISANNIGKRVFLNRQNYANAYYANNNLPNKANNNMVKANWANSKSNIVGANLATPVITSPSKVFVKDITAAEVENLANSNLVTNFGSVTGMPNVAANVASFNFGNSAIPVTVTSENHGNQPIGIKILADNLEVRGTVSVSGKMPIYGAVTINGNVPTDGKASVNYSCGSPGII